MLLNDYDPNGDVLVISDVDDRSTRSQGRLDLVNNRQQVQLDPGAERARHVLVPLHHRRRPRRQRQRHRDGDGAISAENSPPEQVRQTSMLVAQGGRATASVLGDWVDPDGDAFYLASATTTPPDTVSYRPEGNVVFVEGGAVRRATVDHPGRLGRPGRLQRQRSRQRQETRRRADRRRPVRRARLRRAAGHGAPARPRARRQRDGAADQRAGEDRLHHHREPGDGHVHLHQRPDQDSLSRLRRQRRRRPRPPG